MIAYEHIPHEIQPEKRVKRHLFIYMEIHVREDENHESERRKPYQGR